MNLTSNQRDVLQEIVNIGAGNAATGLSRILKEKIDMSVPSINLISFEGIFSKITGEEIVYGIIVRVLGEAPGNVLIVLDEHAAKHLLELLVDDKVKSIDSLGESALCEIGNIVSSAYMSNISALTNLEILPSVPALTQDMFYTILSTTFIESGQCDDKVLAIDTCFTQDNLKLKVYFYYIPMPGSLEKMLESIGE